MQNENELYNVQFWSYTIQKGELKKKIKISFHNYQTRDARTFLEIDYPNFVIENAIKQTRNIARLIALYLIYFLNFRIQVHSVTD